MGASGSLASYLEQVDNTAKGEALAGRQDLLPYLGFDDLGSLAYGTGYTERASKWLDEVYDSSLSTIASDDEIRNIRRYIRLLMGNQWPGDRADFRPSPVINKILKHFWDLLAALTDVRLNINVTSRNKELAHNDEILTKVAQANYQAQKGIMSLIFTVMHAQLGFGATKVAYSREKDDVVFIPGGSDTIIPILGSVFDIQESVGMIYRCWKPLGWFSKFSNSYLVHAEASNESNYVLDKPYSIDEYSWSALAPGLREYLYATTENAQKSGDPAWASGKMPVALFSEFWIHDPQLNGSGKTLTMGQGNWSYQVQPGERIYPWGRLIGTAHQQQRVILYDIPNPHWHGRFPFAPLRLRPTVWSWSGISEIRDLWPIQEAVNRVPADGLSLLNQAANQTLLVKDRAISDAAWNNYFPGMAGNKMKVLNPALPFDNLIRWVSPDMAALSAIVPMYQMVKSAFDEISGDLDINRLAGKKQVPSPDSIAEMRETQQGAYRIKGTFLDEYFREMGILAVSDICQYWTNNRIVAMYGSDGYHWTTADWDPKTIVPFALTEGARERGAKFVSQLQYNVAAGSALPSQRREDAQMSLILAKMGMMDPESLYEALQNAGWRGPAWKKVEGRLARMAQMMPQKPQGRGGRGGGSKKEQAATMQAVGSLGP